VAPWNTPALCLAGALLAVTFSAGPASSATPPASAGAPEAAQHSAAAWSRVSRWTTLRDARIDEASGVARSTYRRSVVFVHNDSGDSARFFAIGRNGATKAVFRVRGTTALDWEDVATGPKHTLWFGDIGDNTTSRSSISVVRVKEPRTLHSRAVRGTSFRLRYPDGAHNAEALLVRPGSGRVYVVTKDGAGGTIYRAPRKLSTGKVNVLHAVGSAPTTVTGGDFAPDGKQLVLRNYTKAYVYSRLGGSAKVYTLPSQHQGEAITYTRTGNAWKVVSEGVGQPIWLVRR